MEYKKYKLGDICKIFGRIGFRGYTTEDLVLSPSYGAISLSPSNIVDGIMDLSKCTYISWAKYEESPEIKITPNDIVIVKTGNSYGRTAIIRNVEHPMTLNPQFVVLKDIQINPVYLAYFLKTDEFQKQIYGIVGGSAIPTLSQEDLASLIVRVPNENIQNTIADILDSLDGKIELNKLINDNLEAMAKQLYDYWFVQFDFPNEDGKPYKSSGGAMVWNNKLKREIPVGWSVKNLGQIATSYQQGLIRSNNQLSTDSKYGYLKMGDLDGKGQYTLQGLTRTNATNEEVDLYSLHKGDFLINVRNSKEIVGKTCLIGYVERNTLYNHMLVRLDFKDVSTFYMNLLFNSEFMYKALDGLKQGTTTVIALYQSDLYRLPILIPAPCVMEQFSKITDSILDQKEIISHEIAELTKQRDELLPLLMNGQAVVNSD